MGASHDPTDLERRALGAVANVVRLAEPLIFDLWRSHELTLAQVQCLRILSVQDEQAGDLAKKLSMSSTSLTRVLERLESRQLVERTMDLHDRRRIWVRLTPTGRNQVSSLTSWYSSPLFTAIQDMPTDEVEQLIEVLHRYSQAVRECDSAEISLSPSLSEEIR
jgi:DNA-binding MarR family transcriptional regulator